MRIHRSVDLDMAAVRYRERSLRTVRPLRTSRSAPDTVLLAYLRQDRTVGGNLTRLSLRYRQEQGVRPPSHVRQFRLAACDGSVQVRSPRSADVSMVLR